MIAPAARPDLGACRRIAIAFSGVKDSIAVLRLLLKLGVPPHAIEVRHHEVDCNGLTYTDWGRTAMLDRSVAAVIGTPASLRSE